MLQKHRRVLILLIGLLYVYSVCPFLCAVFEQKFCHDTSQKVLSSVTETHLTCCQSTKTNTAGAAESPSESGKSCCSKDLELVLPDDRYDTHESRESAHQSLVSILPVSVTLPVATSESFNIPPTLFSTLFPDHSLTRRGPPSA